MELNSSHAPLRWHLLLPWRRRRGGGGAGLPPSGGGNGAGTSIQVTGTGAKGAALVGAAVAMTCANGAKLTGATNGNGAYTTNQAALTYPCIGTAKAGAVSYRSVLFSRLGGQLHAAD